MKRILTLLIALGAITVAQAQSSRSYPNDRNTNRDVILGDRNDRSDRNDRYDGRYENNTRYSYSFSARERDKQIDRINRDFDKQIRQVERDRRMRSSEKTYQVRRLETQRREEIREVWDRFQSRNNAHSDNRHNNRDRRW
ncbi:MAG TPA: hypothetical protein VGN63_04630 [Flavisolibacter sp.]|jgi:hypothetical protein|nr:hypothetical protein [Flavisolibacter sp.]